MYMCPYDRVVDTDLLTSYWIMEMTDYYILLSRLKIKKKPVEKKAIHH